MYLHKSHRPTWVEIDLDVIRHNFLTIRDRCPQGTQFMGVVKADAYGHGGAAISQEILRYGVEYLAVSNIDEAIELRSSGISSPVVLFGPVDAQEFGKLIEFNIYPTVFSVEYAKELAEAYRYRGVYPKIHIKVDSGMGRLGIPIDRAVLEIEQIAQMGGMIIDGVYSHFPSADADMEFSQQQIQAFSSMVSELKRLELKIRHYHIANSAAVFHLPESTNAPFTMIRPGLGLYGYSTTENPAIQNSMAFKTRIGAIRQMKKGDTISYLRTYKVTKEKEWIAILPIGYADGISTLYSNKGRVFIKDNYYPVVGRVCMDYLMVSLGSNAADIHIGDEVILFGEGKITVEEMAKVCQKIPYEVTCDISKRVPRIYLRKEDKRKEVPVG